MDNVIIALIGVNIMLTFISAFTAAMVWVAGILKAKNKASQEEIKAKLANYQNLFNTTTDPAAKIIFSDKIEELTKMLKSPKNK